MLLINNDLPSVSNLTLFASTADTNREKYVRKRRHRQKPSDGCEPVLCLLGEWEKEQV